VRDVIVVGSGAAGLCAALSARQQGARVTLLESTSTIGGTTALSGGVGWFPANHRAVDIGMADDAEQGRRYLRSLELGDVDVDLLDVFVDHSRQTAMWAETSTDLRWVPLPYPDYHCELSGGVEGGRSLEPTPFRPRPDVARLLRPPLSWRLPITQSEAVMDQIDLEVVAQRQRDGVVTMGAALVGAILTAVLDAGVEVRTGARARHLVRDGTGVTGVELDTGEQHLGAVILATGGFERDRALADAFLRAPVHGLTGAPGCRGDGLRMAMSAGAELGNMSEAWWCPAIRVPGDEIEGEPLYRLILNERARPGALMVDTRGHRFANEAQNYNDVGRALHSFDPAGFRFERDPSWLVFDAAYRRRYHVGPVLSSDPDPDWFLSADSIMELGERMDVPPETLVTTVARFNMAASDGRDPEFGRGDTAYDRFVGDRSAHHPNLRPLDHAPFYAVRVAAGLLGTKGGPRTDDRGRVRHVDGGVIPGLYAAGNAAASPLGMAYPGAGGTIGPAMVFGVLAGEAAAHE
jgi:3-oxosteroid 1-dehydrogenase